jgi:hypothetical protein
MGIAAAHIWHDDGMPKFDLARTVELAELFAVPHDRRDGAWIARFYAAIPDATLMSFPSQVDNGPDSFPYFQLAMPDPGPLTPFCLSHVLDYVLDRGCGMVIFGDSSRSKPPEWVFTYGDLLSYSLYRRFEGESPEPVGGEATAGGAHQILKAAPSEAYLPARARRVLGSYMHRVFQLPSPKVALIVDPKLTPARNLMVNLSLEQYHGDKRKLDAAMRYLLWFLPRTYSLMPLPPGWDESGFVALE